MHLTSEHENFKMLAVSVGCDHVDQTCSLSNIVTHFYLRSIWGWLPVFRKLFILLYLFIYLFINSLKSLESHFDCVSAFFEVASLSI